MTDASGKLRGVNLGGWLVLERWLVPSVFGRKKAPDEFTLCERLGENKKQVFKRHRDSFITKQDFKWIADNGLNAVRLPVGHWLFGGAEPFVASARYVDKALEWAKEYNLQVILDLHTAPGSQSGWVSSGRVGGPGWHTDPEKINQTVGCIAKIAEKYGKHSQLWGIELLNEPHPEIPLSILQDYYRRAYRATREYTAERVLVIMSDAYRPIAEWEDFIRSPEFNNVLLDLHLYQTFSEQDKKLSMEEHIAKTFRWKRMIEKFGAEKLLVGEWSAVIHDTYQSMSPESARAARRLYTQAQEYAFAECTGWLYWNYKTEVRDDWNYRHLKENGLI